MDVNKHLVINHLLCNNTSWIIYPSIHRTRSIHVVLIMYKYLKSVQNYNNSRLNCLYTSTAHSNTHTLVNDETLRGPLLFFPLSLYLTQFHRLCTRMTSEDRWEQRTDSRGPVVPIEKCPRRVWPSMYRRIHLCLIFMLNLEPYSNAVCDLLCNST